MDDSLLMGMLHRVTDVDKQAKSFFQAKLMLLAILGDRHAPHQFHHKVGSSRLGRSRIEHRGDIGMVHHRQRLLLGCEAGKHLAGVHAGIDQLEGNPPS